MKTMILVSLTASLALAAHAQTATTTTTAQIPDMSSTASAGVAEGESRTKLSEALKNKKFEENKEITDAKLKAESGSLSRYSLKFSLGYYGPTVDDFSKKNQPNPDGSVSNNLTSLKGSISGLYRFSSSETLSMGTGLSALTPFHGIQRVDTSDPYLSYNLTDRLGDVQMRNSFGVSYVTNPDYVKVGEYGGLNWDSSFITQIGTSRFSTGIDSSVSYYLYNRRYETKDRKAVQASLGLYPQLKYTFTDKLSMNTSIAMSWWNLRRRENIWLLENRTLSQRLGLGYAIRRDIYFSPYLNFYPERLTADTTTFNFSTVFSIL